MMERALGNFSEAEQIKIGKLFEKANKRNSVKNLAIASFIIIATAAILGQFFENNEREKPVSSSPTATTVFSAHPTPTTLPK